MSSLQQLQQSHLPDTSSSEADENQPCYKCKMCRYKLFSKAHTVTHLREDQEGATTNKSSDWKFQNDYYAQLAASENVEKVCDREIFIEPVSWLQDRLHDLNGKINCPKCNAKLGSFDWAGSTCSCGAWVTPAFHIAKSKVDFCDLPNQQDSEIK